MYDMIADTKLHIYIFTVYVTETVSSGEQYLEQRHPTAVILAFIEWMKVKEKVMSISWQPRGLCSPWNSLGQSARVGSLSLLQGIFPTQGSNLGLPHCRQTLYQLSHKGSSSILEWAAYPFSGGSSTPRNQTGGSCFAGTFFTKWATREPRWMN